MFTEDLRKDFYSLLFGKRCIIIVNFDIDAICACKILQSLFKIDNIIYTVVPVRGITDLKVAYQENYEEAEYFILINCGGTIDIVELLEPEENIIFFIIDSHKPTDVCNIYSDKQIRIVGSLSDNENLPDFSDIFREDTDDEDSNSEDGSDDNEDRAAKRRRLDEEGIIKRREKRQWEEKRHKLMFEYTQFSYYGRSSAMLIFELAWKLSKDSNELLWWAIVGVTEQLLLGKIENEQYVLETGNLQQHMSRLSHQASNNQVNTALKISFDKDLRLALYRHWTVELSVKNSMYTACQLRLWTLKGDKRLLELLAEMGLPLVQSRQNFSSMDLVLRKEFHEKIEALAEKYNLEDIVYASFMLQYGYRSRYCASDIVYAMLAILETTTGDKTPENYFMNTIDCLSRTNKDILETGITNAKKILTMIFKQVQSLLDMKQIVSAGPFLYLIIEEGSFDCNIFSHPHCLTMLAQFALRAHVAVSRNRKASTLPLICSSPLDILNGTCLVVGIPPMSEDSPKNFFGKAFEQAAENSKATMVPDYFDSSIVQLLTKDRTQFLDALTTLLS